MAEKIGNEAISNAYTYRKRQYLTYLIEYLMSYKIEITYGLVEDKSRYGILDIGGDERGAYALGRFSPYIREENDYDMFYVVNFHRPLTRNAEDAYYCMKEIEVASGLAFTGIINNSNLGAETTLETITETYGEAEKLSGLSNIPIVAVTAEKSIATSEMVALNLQKRIFD